MSLSIYSFVNPANICHADLKAFFDTIQLNEDKLHSKLTKTAFRKLRKYIPNEDLSDSELVKESLAILRQAKATIKSLDTKVSSCLEYQESIISDFSLSFDQHLEQTIMRDRVEYDTFKKFFLPIDIFQFTQFDEEYSFLSTLKMPFILLPPYIHLIDRLRSYIQSYDSLKWKLHDLESRYKTILDKIDKIQFGIMLNSVGRLILTGANKVNYYLMVAELREEID